MLSVGPYLDKYYIIYNINLPYLKKLASICLKLYNLDISHSTFSGCAKIIIRLAGITIAEEDSFTSDKMIF
jgi:hypothetical protein